MDRAENPESEQPADTANLVSLHESIASLLASRGQFRQAYQHLRSALDLVSEFGEGPQIPEQFRREVDRLRREHAEAHEQSIRDSLTTSYNRRYLDRRLVDLMGAAGHAGAVAVALVDLDWFKQVNDTFGHLVGDRVLQQVVELLTAGLPEGAFCARYGGEEFVLVLPGFDLATAVALAETARARVEHYPWASVVLGLRVTVSIGVTHEQTTGVAEDTPGAPERQLREADALLYTAKQSGRNAVAYLRDGKAHLAGAAGNRRVVVPPRAGMR
ncbi:GGDEF domain-containing protein [Actinokineospora sp. G85]|uniref:GGDEF domain-containing protein n=1 Tax=Actinokineospora sp. G85 TaxID=3406626 RepID=UPI003C754360